MADAIQVKTTLLKNLNADIYLESKSSPHVRILDYFVKLCGHPSHNNFASTIKIWPTQTSITLMI